MKQHRYSKSFDHLAEDHQYHLLSDPHHQASALSYIILGGQDGLVNVLGVILGVAAATSDTHIVTISSLGGKMGLAGNTSYTTSKYALHGFYDSLRMEMRKPERRTHAT